MSSTNTSQRLILIVGRILLLLIVVVGALKFGTPASYMDPYGLFFVLVSGVALAMISFPGTEIWHAFRHAAGRLSSDAELRNSIHFWEAAGRSFWILGGLHSILSMIIGFAGMATAETTGLPAILPILIRSLLSTFYGCLLAVVCFVPCWKLMGKLQSLRSTQSAENSRATVSRERVGWGFQTVIGYVLFLTALVVTIRLPNLSLSGVLIACIPSFLVVLGGALALILFMGGNNPRLTPSAAFAGMGLIGSLMGFIQMLHGMTNPGPQGIGQVASALAFILSSCFIGLLGTALLGAPLEDRAVRTGVVDAPSAFSRVSWYVFPLLSLIFLVLVFNMIILPLPAAR